MLSRLLKIVTVFDVLIIISLLFFAFFYQLIYYALPCALCLLQRLGFLAIAMGFLSNMRFGYYANHYAFILMSGLFTLAVSGLQILLHVSPTDPGFGSTVFGLHFYTWSFIAAFYFVISSTLLLFFNTQFSQPVKKLKADTTFWVLISLILLLVIMNLIAVFLECGITLCPSTPGKYLFFTLSDSQVCYTF